MKTKVIIFIAMILINMPTLNSMNSAKGETFKACIQEQAGQFFRTLGMLLAQELDNNDLSTAINDCLLQQNIFDGDIYLDLLSTQVERKQKAEETLLALIGQLGKVIEACKSDELKQKIEEMKKQLRSIYYVAKIMNISIIINFDWSLSNLDSLHRVLQEFQASSSQSIKKIVRPRLPLHYDEPV